MTTETTELLSAEIGKVKRLYASLGPVRRFFFPAAIKQAITKDLSDHEISDVITKGTWYTHRLMFPELARFKLTHDAYEQIEVRVERITRFYNASSPFQKFFFPTAFKELMKRKDLSPLDVTVALYQGTRFYHKIFFPSVLGGYFTSGNTASARWLFDPKGIPETEVGKGIENNLNELESLYNIPTINTAVADLEEYFNDHFFVKFMLPGALRDLLEKKNTEEPNRKIRLTLAAHHLPWYSRLLMRVFYPSMIKHFLTSEGVSDFYNAIKKNTTLQGDLRVQRNLKTLKDIAKKVTMANISQEKTQITFSPTLENDIANLICQLNRYGTELGNINAQRTLDLIRLYAESGADENAILYVCDALTLYFKEYPHDDGNRKLKELVEAFKNNRDFLELYVYLRQEEIGLFNTTDPSVNRINLDCVQKINQKDDARSIIEILFKHQLIAKSNAHRQENFKRFIEFQNDPANQLVVFNQKLVELSAALQMLSPTHHIEQTLFDAFMLTGGTAVHLIEKFTSILSLMNLPDEALKAEAYPLFLNCVKQKHPLGSEHLSAYLTKLEVAMRELSAHNELNIAHLKLLLADNADPIKIKDELLKKSSPITVTPPIVAENPQPEEKRVAAESNESLIRGMFNAFRDWFIPAAAVAAPQDERSPQPPQPEEERVAAATVAAHPYVPFYDITTNRVSNPQQAPTAAAAAPQAIVPHRRHYQRPERPPQKAREATGTPNPPSAVLTRPRRTLNEAEYALLEAGMPLPPPQPQNNPQNIVVRQVRQPHPDSIVSVLGQVALSTVGILWGAAVKSTAHPDEDRLQLPYAVVPSIAYRASALPLIVSNRETQQPLVPQRVEEPIASDPASEVPVASAQPENQAPRQVFGFNAQDVTGYATTAATTAGILGVAYALYADPSNTSLTLASYVLTHVSTGDVRNFIGSARNRFFSQVPTKTPGETSSSESRPINH